MIRSDEMLNRLTSASNDLENCLRFLDETTRHEYGSTVYESLLVSAVIFYARPFSQNEKRGSQNPSEPRVPEEVLNSLTNEEADFHEHIVNLRNKAVAHAEWSYHPAGVTDKGIVTSMPFSILAHFRGASEIATLKHIASKVRAAIQQERANQVRKRP